MTRPKAAAKIGRPAKLAKMPATYEQVEILAGFGLTDEELAQVLGVCRTTVAKHKIRDAKFREALRAGKAKADMNVVKGLYTRATMGNDTTAAIFWLKNRQPERWRDRRDLNLGGQEDGSPVALKIQVVHTRGDAAPPAPAEKCEAKG